MRRGRSPEQVLSRRINPAFRRNAIIPSVKTFAEHRKALMRRLPDGLILLSGGREVPRNHDVNYVFRQGSNFLYRRIVGRL